LKILITFSNHLQSLILALTRSMLILEISIELFADKIIEILLSANDILIGQDVLSELLSMAENENNKVAIASQMLSNYKYNNDGISALLDSLGGMYVEIAERRKRPILENSVRNVNLLFRLKDLGFISSMTPEKGGIRVNPKRN